MKKIIYDFGANNGDDIPYYLMKADLVIAVEANPALCTLIETRFPEPIEDGKLVIENYVLVNEPTNKRVPFYLHDKKHILSQFPEPAPDRMSVFSKVELPAITPIDLLEKHGEAHYIKIDLEHYDAEVLRLLFRNQIYPEYISAESHSPEIFCLLVAYGGYDAFKLVDGATVPLLYKDAIISALNGHRAEYSFPAHSAGPYGEDISGEWLSGRAMLRKLGFYGCGWRDLHATNTTKGTHEYSLREEIKQFCSIEVRKRIGRLRRKSV